MTFAQLRLYKPWILEIKPSTQTVVVCCSLCRVVFDVSVPTTQVIRWVEGALAQDAMPDLSLADRELLISGTCGPCFDELFSE